jgi:uncharacterized protein YaeQ
VPKLLSQEKLDKRVKTLAAFIKIVKDKGRTFLCKIITIDESAVLMRVRDETSVQQWLTKGAPGPKRTKVIASCTKQMVLAFFDNKRMVYTNHVPRGATVNVDYIICTLKKFLKVLYQKRPDLGPGDWIFHCNNALVHTT